MTVNETALSLDDTIRAEGQPLGRFTLITPDDYDVADNGWDWYPDPDGTHDGYLWQTGIYCLPHVDQPASDFYGYVTDNDDVTQYSDDGLRKAYAWAEQEMRDLADEHDLYADDPRAARTKGTWNRIADEMAKRQLPPLGVRW